MEIALFVFIVLALGAIAVSLTLYFRPGRDEQVGYYKNQYHELQKSVADLGDLLSAGWTVDRDHGFGGYLEFWYLTAPDEPNRPRRFPNAVERLYELKKIRRLNLPCVVEITKSTAAAEEKKEGSNV